MPVFVLGNLQYKKCRVVLKLVHTSYGRMYINASVGLPVLYKDSVICTETMTVSGELVGVN